MRRIHDRNAHRRENSSSIPRPKILLRHVVAQQLKDVSDNQKSHHKSTYTAAENVPIFRGVDAYRFRFNWQSCVCVRLWKRNCVPYVLRNLKWTAAMASRYLLSSPPHSFDAISKDKLNITSDSTAEHSAHTKFGVRVCVQSNHYKILLKSYLCTHSVIVSIYASQLLGVGEAYGGCDTIWIHNTNERFFRLCWKF